MANKSKEKRARTMFFKAEIAKFNAILGQSLEEKCQGCVIIEFLKYYCYLGVPWFVVSQKRVCWCTQGAFGAFEE